MNNFVPSDLGQICWNYYLMKLFTLSMDFNLWNEILFY